MEKIKINLMSGSSLEKPLVSAFKGNNAIYVVLDNEINGTMGLPIILVSKLENNRLTKINDQNEWNAVKESLRMIIAGNQVDYVVVDPMLGADDMFFSQLTLPVASFDALKNNYRPNAENAGAVANAAPIDNGMSGMVNPMPTPNPMENMTSPVQPAASIDNVSPQVNPTPVMEPVMPQPQVVDNSQVMSQNNSVSPMGVAPVSPVMPSAPVDAQSVVPVGPTPIVESPVPNVEPIPAQSVEQPASSVDFTADKEAFLKACENMFDALVAKFKN